MLKLLTRIRADLMYVKPGQAALNFMSALARAVHSKQTWQLAARQSCLTVADV